MSNGGEKLESVAERIARLRSASGATLEEKPVKSVVSVPVAKAAEPEPAAAPAKIDEKSKDTEASSEEQKSHTHDDGKKKKKKKKGKKEKHDDSESDKASSRGSATSTTSTPHKTDSKKPVQRSMTEATLGTAERASNLNNAHNEHTSGVLGTFSNKVTAMFNSKPITASQEVPPSPSSIDTTNITVEGDVEAWKKEKASLLHTIAGLQRQCEALGKEMEREKAQRIAADAQVAKLKTQLARTSHKSSLTPLQNKKMSKEEREAAAQQRLAELYFELVSMRQKFWSVCIDPKHPEGQQKQVAAPKKGEASFELMQALRSYVSLMAVRRLMADRNGLSKLPVLERCQSTVVFADISGFTPLTERMAAKGREGVEQLTFFLNQFFGELVSLVHQYGGDIVKFAGDAVLAHWPSDPEARQHEALQACQCSLALQTKLHNFPVEGGALTLHVGVASGEVACIYVGGVGSRIEFLLAGKPLEDVATCEKDASPGEVYISPETHSLVEDFVKCSRPKNKTNYLMEKFEKGAPSPTDLSIITSPELEKPLRSFLAPAVSQRLTSATTTLKFLAELRTVTVLFCSLQIPFTGDDNEVPRVQEAVVVMQKSLQKFGGTLRQFIVDDKGSVLIGAWGLPPLSHENDPERAVRTALEILQSLFQLGIMSSIGITTGQVFCGDVGSNARREYAVVGDIVNLSARLMAHATGGVLCDKETYQLSRDAIEYIALPAIKVKGKKHPIEVYKPRSAKSAETAREDRARRAEQTMSVDLIGRDEELQKIQARVNELVALQHRKGDDVPYPNATVVIIKAAAGLGKTRLLAELRHRYLKQTAKKLSASQRATLDTRKAAQLQSDLESAMADANFDRVVDLRDKLALTGAVSTAQYLAGHGSQLNANLQFSGWAGILATLLRAPASEDEKGGWRIRKEALDLLGDRAPLLNDVLRDAVSLQPTKVTAEMAAQVRAEATQKVLLELLQAFVKPGAVLAFDDVQYLDTASWKLLRTACASMTGVLVAIAARPPKGRVGYDFYQIMQLEGCSVMELRPFDSVTLTQQLAAKLMGVEKISEGIAKELHQKSEGNPYVCVEMVQSVKSLPGFAIDSKGQVTASETDPVDYIRNSMPRNVSALITSKVDRLTLSQQTTLKFASVVGLSFTASMVEALLPERDRAKVQSDLDAMCRFGLLRSPDMFADGDGAQRGVLKGSMAKATIAASKRAKNTHSSGQYASEPQYSFCNARTHDVVYDLMLFAQRRELHAKCAEELRRRHGDGRWSEQPIMAYHFAAAELWPEAFKFYKKAGDVSTYQWANQEAVAFYSKASQIADTLAKEKKKKKHKDLQFDALDHISIKRKSATALLNIGAFSKANVELTEALALLGIDMPSEKKQMSRQAAKHIKFKIKPDKRKAIASDPHLSREAIVCLVTMTRICYFECRKTTAEFCVYMILQIVSDPDFHSNDKLLTQLYRASILTNGLSGQHEMAVAQIQEGAENAREQNQIEEVGRIHQSAGMYYSSVGQWKNAIESLSHAMNIAEKIGDRRLLEECLVFLSHVHYLQGDLFKSLTQAELALKKGRERGDVQTQQMALIAQSRALYFLGQNDKCVKALADVGATFAASTSDVVLSSRIVYNALISATQLQSDQFKEAYETMHKNINLLQHCEPTCYFTVTAYLGVVETLVKLIQLDDVALKSVGSGVTRAKLTTEMSSALDVLYEFDQTFVISQPRSLLWKGVHEGWKGRMAKSEAKMQAALEQAEKLEMTFDAAVITYYQGKLAKNDQTKSAALLKRAFSMFENTGVRFSNQL